MLEVVIGFGNEGDFGESFFCVKWGWRLDSRVWEGVGGEEVEI